MDSTPSVGPGRSVSSVGRSPERLLLIQTYFLGDVLLATPAIRAARRAFPDARIEFLTGAAGAGALERSPHLDEVIRLDARPGGQWRLLREVRRRRYHAVVDFLSNPRTALVTAASGAPVRIGIRGRGPRNFAYTHLAPREAGPVYVGLQKLRLLRYLGIEVGAEPDLRLEIAIGAEERRWAEAAWSRCGLRADARVVAVSAVSRERFKQWGAERWAAVADRLAGAGFQVLLTSGPGERAQVAAVAEHMRHAAVWDYGPTTVRQLAALYERCILWVGNDGGPKHIAAAAGVPTVSVIRWTLGPAWTDDRAVPLQVAIDRPPPQGCDRRCVRCAHVGCLAAVPPDAVVDAALEALEAARAGARLDIASSPGDRTGEPWLHRQGD